MIKAVTFFFAFLVFVNLCSAQDFQQEFNVAIQENDTLKQEKLLRMWEQFNPKDPELFIAFFNHYYLLSKKEVITLTAEPPVGESFSIADSTGQTSGYFSSDVSFDRDVFQKAIDKIDEGILLYPDRLDMRFGKIYVLGRIEDWQPFTDEIIKTIRYSAHNNNQWAWTDGEAMTEGEVFFLTSLQDYQLELYNTNNDELLVNMREIANEILNYYPNHVESITNIGITYMLIGEYDLGIDYFKKAEKINPEDEVIISNIAYSYKVKGKKKMAVNYYKKLLKSDEPELRKYAEEQINELK